MGRLRVWRSRRRVPWVCVGACLGLLCITLLMGCGDTLAAKVSKDQAIAIASEYLRHVDNSHTTAAPPGATAPPTDELTLDVTKAILSHPDLPPDLPDSVIAWTIKMNTSRTSFPVTVVIDAVSGEVIGAAIW